jgi:beta-phosphoglucomutase-like phosphatase (HAD superfamily)
MNRYDAVALDFDGTIADSYAIHTQSRVKAFIAHGLGDVDPNLHELAHNHGSSPQQIIGWILKQIGRYDEVLLEAIIADKKAIYRDIANTDGLPPISGAIEFIRNNARARTIGIVTVSHSDEVMAFLRANGLAGMIEQDLIITGDIPGFEPKPSPFLYNEFLRRTSMIDKPMQAVGIEDSVHGVESLNRAGMASIAIATTHNVNDWSLMAGDQKPYMIVKDYKELAELLESSYVN